ncbi:MAG: M48 family metallopeptidase [Parvibaculum sp.]|nr:M48 family metallopeptidase [Parvibaculum sp.]
MRKTGPLAAALLAAPLLLVSQCAAITYERPVPDKAAIEAAKATIEQAAIPAKSSRTIDELVDMADRAAQGLRASMPDLCAAIQSETCSFSLRIAGNEEASAFVDGNGVVWITVGLLQYLDGEDEIAAILAHEIGHRLNGDDLATMSAKRRHQAMRYALGGSSPSSAASRISGGARYLIGREADADYLAAFLLKRAGYDLAAGERLWITLAKVGNNRAASILATHPLSAERLAAWRQISAELDDNPDAMPKRTGG